MYLNTMKLNVTLSNLKEMFIETINTVFKTVVL